MRIFLPLLCALCASLVHSIFDGACLRKDPPPGVLVLSPGSKLVLTCSGHVTVNGAKVRMTRNNSNTSRRRSSSDAFPTTANIIKNTGVSRRCDKDTVGNVLSESGVRAVTGGKRSLPHTHTGYTASPVTHLMQPTRNSRLRNAGEMDWEEDYEDNEEEEGGEEEEEESRVTRSIKTRPQWKWNGKTVGKGDRDWGEVTFERSGAKLSLSSVRLTDSGKYTCNYRGREKFSLKIAVADPPEKPKLSCYKKSPSSKIRCEWAPQKPTTILPKCYLYLTKSPTEALLPQPCSYSSRLSRCWCALDYNDKELRIVHMAFLCVTNIAGNATSTLEHFTPLDILKPDPPSHVLVRQEEGQETRMTVTWSIPVSWKPQDNYYEMMYEVKYKPRKSSIHHQVQQIKGQRFFTISDAIPGVEYAIQLRTKEEFDGQWGEWSAPVYASSWKSPEPSLPSDDFPTTMFPPYMEGSGAIDYLTNDLDFEPEGREVSHRVLWISGSLALMSCLVILALYLFRHKDRFISKLQSVTTITQCGDSPQPRPSAPTAPEGQALVTFTPSHYQEPAPSEVEEEGEREEEGEGENGEEQPMKEKIAATHFTNTSYFFLQT